MKNLNKEVRACLVLFTLLYLFVDQGSVVGAAIGPSKTISSSGQIVMDTNINVHFYAASYSFKEYTNASVVGTFGLSQTWYAPQDASYASRIQQAKAANPNYKALIYRNIKHVYKYWTDEWNTCANKGWLLKDAYGNYVVDSGNPNDYVADIGSTGYQQWVAKVIKNWLGNYTFFDGVFADNGLFVSADTWTYYDSATPINPRTNNRFTDSEIENAFVAVENAIKTAIGNKMLVCNGLWSGNTFYGWQTSFLDLLSRSSLDGAMAEGCWYKNSRSWMSTDQWLQSLQMCTELQSYFGNRPDGALVQCCLVDLGLPSGATQTQLLLYGYCSALLATQNNKNYLGVMAEVNSNPQPASATLIRLMENLNALNLGSSVNSYSQISGTQIYTRDFQNVKVLVNPSSSTYNVQLSSQYHTIDGIVVSGSYSMAPHTGAVLIRG